MIIDQLPQISLPVLDTDELPVERGEYTYKATVDDIISGSSKVTEITEDLTTFARPNLLDNWYFVGGGSQQGGGQFPINQRGQTSYSNTDYTIDRWRLWNGSLTVNNQNITFSTVIENGLFQYYDVAFRGRMLGKAITVSALLSDGTLWYKTGVVSENTNTSIASDADSRGYIVFFTDLASTSYPCGFQIHLYANKSVSVIAVKLELGITQTLAHQENGTWVLNEIPDYSEQLYRCCSSLADSNDTCANNPYYPKPQSEYLTLDDTLVSGTSTSITRYGKLRLLTFSANMRNTGDWQTVCALDQKDRPSVTVTFIIGGYNVSNGEVYVQTDGHVDVNNTSTGWNKGQVIWFVQ